uniref:TMEM205-like domain-containing protein n=1 Tax=Anopheles atroparvus TaxID=41427 RepID=A0AAG5DWG8_ANOAO
MCCCLERLHDTSPLLQAKASTRMMPPRKLATVGCEDEQTPVVVKRSAAMAGDGLHQDLLQKATRATRASFHYLRNQSTRFQRSPLYKILTGTTQPSHAISAIVLSLVVVALWPNLLGSAEEGSSAKCKEPVPAVRASSIFTQIAYLGSFAIHFGAQIWMTFVSGLALYFSLPRHTFGLIQEVLFPKYFTLGTGLSTVSLLSFVELRRSSRPELAGRNLAHWDTGDLVQIVALGATASLELIVRLYLAPPMLRLMHEKHRIEAQASVGQEVGQFAGDGNGRLERSRHYKVTHKKFRQIHMTIAMLNMVTLSCTCVHLLYLATRVSV